MSGEYQDRVNGLIVKDPHANAPDWVIAGLSVKVDEFIQYLKENAVDGWVNLEINKAKNSGKLYPKLNTWRPNNSGGPQRSSDHHKPQPGESGFDGFGGGSFDDDIPF